MRNQFKFVIVSKNIEHNSIDTEFKKIELNSRYTVFVKGKSILIDSDIVIGLDGYCLPRKNSPGNYQQLINLDLIKEVINLKSDLHQTIKGFFSIFIIRKDSVEIYGDHFGIRKFFFEENGKAVSNDLFILNNILICTLSHTSVAKFALFQHNICGETYYNNVRYNRPGELLELGEKFVFRSNWSPKMLVDIPQNSISPIEFSQQFSGIVGDYVKLFSPRGISLTLTGGRDTRTVLASLLSIGVEPSVFTFGFPASADVQTATMLSKKMGLNFANHDFEKTPEWYSDLVDKVIKDSSGLAHLHRAHRYAAIESEVSRISNLDMVFLGSMGGDFIKGVHLNDYIITEFIRLHYFQNKLSPSNISLILDKHFIKYDDALLNDLMTFCQDTSFNDEDEKLVEFNLATEIIGHLHDSQDINIFLDHVKYVVIPFLDVDILEVLFSSKFNLFHHFRISNNPLLQLRGGELQCEMIKTLQPQLAKLPFASGYTPNDLLGNKFYYTSKRIYLKAFKTNKTSNFSYGSWFLNFIKGKLKEHGADENIFDISKLTSALDSKEHKSTEGYWHKYSNIVHINTIEEFMK
ncbi:hypothetical protein MASR1M107_28490 [Ignavibacteriales bacterium]